MRLGEETQALQSRGGAAELARVRDQALDDPPPAADAARRGLDVHSLNLSHRGCQAFQTADTHVLPGVAQDVEAPIGRKELRLRTEIRLDHRLDVEVDAVARTRLDDQPAEVFADQSGGRLARGGVADGDQFDRI